MLLGYARVDRMAHSHRSVLTNVVIALNIHVAQKILLKFRGSEFRISQDSPGSSGNAILFGREFDRANAHQKYYWFYVMNVE